MELTAPLLDPRLTLARPDLAADHLEGIVKATHYAATERYRLIAPVAHVYQTPTNDPAAPMETQWLYGEDIDVLEIKEGWAWGQSLADGYVGYCRADQLAKPGADTTHRVSNLLTHLYPVANLKSTPLQALSYGSAITVLGEENNFYKTPDGFIPKTHLEDKIVHAMEAVSEAFRFLGVPYVWGGRSASGIDCSGLMQLCLQACGIPFPRDMDLQSQVKAKSIARAALQTGDLVFFERNDGSINDDGTPIHGHVGIMVDNSMMIHANGDLMAVAMDDLDDYLVARGQMGKTTRHHCKRLK